MRIKHDQNQTYLDSDDFAGGQKLCTEYFAEAALSNQLIILIQLGRVGVLVLVLHLAVSPNRVQVVEYLAIVLFMICEETIVRVSLVILNLPRDGIHSALCSAMAAIHIRALLVYLLKEVLHLLLEGLVVCVVEVDRCDRTLVLRLAIRVIVDLVEATDVVFRGDWPGLVFGADVIHYYI